MAVTARNLLKQWFETGKKPTQGQFANLIDSFIHRDEDPLSIGDVQGLAAVLAGKASSSQVTAALSLMGALENLTTVDKSSLVGAINELKDLCNGISGKADKADTYDIEAVDNLLADKANADGSNVSGIWDIDISGSASYASFAATTDNLNGKTADFSNEPIFVQKMLVEDVNGKLGASSMYNVKNGILGLNAKADLVGGKVPANQLPSYVDDVLEYADLASFPATGENGKIYIAQDTNYIYRWSGSAYVRVNEGVVLGETSATAYRGDRGKVAYDHSQQAHAPANAQKNSDITKSEIEAKLTGDITSHSHSIGQSDNYLKNTNWDILKSSPFKTKLYGWINNSGALLNQVIYIDSVTGLYYIRISAETNITYIGDIPLEIGGNGYAKLSAWVRNKGGILVSNNSYVSFEIGGNMFGNVSNFEVTENWQKVELIVSTDVENGSMISNWYVSIFCGDNDIDIANISLVYVGEANATRINNKEVHLKTETKFINAWCRGDGLTSIFHIPHGLGKKPNAVVVTANSFDAVIVAWNGGNYATGDAVSGGIIGRAAAWYATADNEYITIWYNRANRYGDFLVDGGYDGSGNPIIENFDTGYYAPDEFTELQWSIMCSVDAPTVQVQLPTYPQP